MARRRRGDEPADDLSVGELIDGPTEILTPEIRAAALAGAAGDADLEKTRDLSGHVPAGGGDAPTVSPTADPAASTSSGASGGSGPGGVAPVAGGRAVVPAGVAERGARAGWAAR
ncbi:hypothetical protein [Verrucosispora sioxanthis]|uniref:hypothetical protein n=1 Tax=Verrucosispora sioxanthis TaxID=2499994 RepID=UPI0020A1FDA1|nr:hypothetical protein [Verrucosispora sioxanthis]